MIVTTVSSETRTSKANQHELEFAKRLNKICDANPYVPPLHSGRLVWVAKQLSERFDEKVSVESVRKWFSGEARPRPKKLTQLAELLEADEAYLALGHEPVFTPRERRARNAVVNGVVNVVAGLIQIDGGSVAFPESEDSDADMTAIIRGGKYDIRVSLGEEEDNGAIRFAAPMNEGVVTLGVVRKDFSFEIYDLAPELFATGQKRGTATEITVKRGDPNMRPVESFRQRL